MDSYGLIDNSRVLRRVLWVWNGVGIAAAVLCVGAGIALIVAGSTGDDPIGDAVAADLAGLAFLALFAVGGLWGLGRAALLVVWRVRQHRRERISPNP